MDIYLNRYFKREVNILSVDGGGIRGIIPAMVLAELEQKIAARKPGLPLCRAFDLLAGTSTGSIIALGLTAPAYAPGYEPEQRTEDEAALTETPPITQPPRSGRRKAKPCYSKKPLFTARDLVQVYRDKGSEIFPRWIFNQLKTVRQAFTEKYNSGRYYAILDSILQDRTIQDALANVLVTSYDLAEAHPLIIKKRPRRLAQKGKDPNFYIRDAIMGSSAAPTFFEPIQVNTVDGQGPYVLIDGSMFANNPAMCAFIEAQKIYPRAKHYRILSLGTGMPGRRYTYQQVSKWGFVEWVLPSKGVPLASMMNTGQAQCVDYQLQYHPRVTYHRLNIPLEGCDRSMDDASPENIACLQDKADELIEANQSLLENLAEQLT